MERFSSFVVRRRVPVLIVTLLVMAAAGYLGSGVAGRLSSGGFQDENAESFRAGEVLAEQFDVGIPSIVMVATAPGSVDDLAVAAAGIALTEQIASEDHVTEATSYWSLGSPPSLKSEGGNRAMLFVSLDVDQNLLLETSGEIADKYRGTFEGLEIAVGGQGPLFAEVTETIEADLVKSESIAFPITFVLLIIVFGSVVAALLPLGVGAFAIVGTFLALDVIARLTEVSIFSLNLTTALGLGLGIDYALFIVSRYREELTAGHDGHEAARRTIRTAGRTVAFSAGTVMVSLAAMMVFPLPFLRSFAYAGIAVVALAGLGAVVALPALLAVLGKRVDKLAVRKQRPPTGTGVWHRVAMAVMRRPIPIATAAVLLLVALGLPFLRVNLVQSDDRVLPASSPAREVGDILRAEFNSFESAAIQVVAPTTSDGQQVDQHSVELSSLEGVARVDSSTGSYIDGVQVIPAGPGHAHFAAGGGNYWSVIPAIEPGSEEAEGLVRSVRALDAPEQVLVGGITADLVDTKQALFASLPLALGIIGLVTFVVLFLMFGSILVPAKAVVLNLLSLSATFGALVWIFQEGNLSDLLGFTSTGGLDLTMPILMFAISFGLSMDYEVFLLSRIKEEHDKGADDVSAVALGLERTGRIVTAAAVLIAVVFVSFATSQVMIMKMFGIGMTLAVLVDAFIVRAALVPAFMRLAGRANWWAPRWMQPLYRRFGINESEQPHRATPPVEETV